jgi:hypothetical protein
VKTIIVAACALLAIAQATPPAAPQTFTASASAKKGTVSVAADVAITVSRYASDQERDTVLKAMKIGGAAARQALVGMKDAGYIQMGERRTPIKFATERPTASGTLVTVVTAEPMLFLGAGVPAAKKTAEHDLAVALFEVKDREPGQGELAAAAKVSVDNNGAVLIQDYGDTVIWLQKVVRAKK